jgi:hypothetical protein
MDLCMELAIYFQVNADRSDNIDYKYQVGITRWIYLFVSRSKLMAVTSLGDDSTGSCFRRR